MSSLEAKIRALLEGHTEDSISEDEIEVLEEKETIKTKGGTTITDDDDSDSDKDKSEPDGDEDGEDTDNDGDGKDDEDTDYSKDTKKDKADVVQEEISKKMYAALAHRVSDPNYEGSVSLDHVISKAKKSHGDKFANQIASSDKAHWPKYGLQSNDKLATRTFSRVNVDGKANKQDIRALKSKLMKEGFDELLLDDILNEETTGLKQGTDNVSGATDTLKIKAGQSRKDEVKTGKITSDASTGGINLGHDVKMRGAESDGSADTLKIKAGQSRKDEVKTGKIPGEHNTNEPNAKNQGNVKIAMSEHMDAIFNGEELSEEFMNKTRTIFEAAVESSAQAKFETMMEEHEAQLNEQAEQMASQINEAVEEVKSELVEDIDGFLNYVVEQWVSDNEVALQSGVKVDLVDSFIDGM